MIRLIISLVIFLGVRPLHAETVRVLSGEHQGYTRLVLVFEKPTRWTFGRNGETYELRLGRKDVELDISAVFDRVARERLADLAVIEGGNLGLTVVPGNRAVPYDLRAGVLVIDIRTGAPPPESRFEAALPAMEARGVQPSDRFRHLPGSQLVIPRADPPDLLWSGLEKALHRSERAASPLPIPWRATAVNVPAPVTGVHGDVAIVARAKPAQDLILRQIARAAAQGLLTPTGPIAPTQTEHMPAVEEQDTPSKTKPPAAMGLSPDLAQMNVTAETSVDRDSFSIVRRTLSGATDHCPEAVLIDVAAWAGAGTPGEQIAARRQELLGEFDRARGGAVADMAKTYVYLGFGAEAASVLNAFHVSIPEADLLLSLAAIMDGDLPPAASRLRAVAGCGGPADLWALLANAPATKLPNLDVASVQRSFSALPLHLRRLLAPEVAGRLVDLGMINAATAVQDAVTRAPGDPGAGTEVLSARLNRAAGALPESEDALLKVILDDGPKAAEALILYVDERVEQNLPVPRKIVEQAAALAFEHRSAPEGPALARAEVLAAAVSGDFRTGFSALRRWQARGEGRQTNNPEASAAIIGPAFGLLASQASDEAFLREVFASGVGTDRMPILPAEVAQAVSERLLTLGFSTEARAVRAATGQNDPVTRLFLARVALAQFDGVEALRTLAGLEGPQAAQLRGQALVQIGNHAAAEQIFSQAGDLTGAARAAWAAGDWQRYATLADDERSAILERLGIGVSRSADGTQAVAGLNENTAETEPGTPGGLGAEGKVGGALAFNRRLLEDSSKSRSALADLRATFGPVEVGQLSP